MDIVQNRFKKVLRRRVSGLKEVSSPEKCQAILYFCPIASRAGTDIDMAMNQLNHVKASTPVIMVILYHTFDPEKIVPDNDIARKRENTFAVDCLFYEDKLLKCKKNDDAFDKTKEYFKSKNLTSYYCFNTDREKLNLSTDPNAENHPLINGEDSHPSRTQEDTSWFGCCPRLCFQSR